MGSATDCDLKATMFIMVRARYKFYDSTRVSRATLLVADVSRLWVSGCSRGLPKGISSSDFQLEAHGSKKMHMRAHGPR